MYIQSKLGSAAQITATWLQLKRYMSSKLDTVLTLSKYGTVRIGNGIITEVAKRDENGMKWNQAAYIKVVLTLPDPWFLSEERRQFFVTSTPLILFPFTVPAGGITAGAVTSGNTLTFSVAGEDAPGCLITLTARGAVVNPTVTNQRGEFVKALVTMADGDIVTIDTGDKPYVRLNGVWCSRDRSSTFFDLAVGENTITVSADSGVDLLIKTIEYQERYQ